MTKPNQKITTPKPGPVDNGKGESVVDAATPVSPAPAFPVDAKPSDEAKRGPGRPPNKCSVCGKLASECKGHTAIAVQFGPDSVKGILQMFSHLVALSLSLSTGTPMQGLSQACKFSDGELALIAPSAAEVLNDVLPSWMVAWEKELKLGFILLPVLITKMTVAHAMVTAHKQAQQKEAPANATPSPAAIPSEGRPLAAAA